MRLKYNLLLASLPLALCRPVDLENRDISQMDILQLKASVAEYLKQNPAQLATDLVDVVEPLLLPDGGDKRSVAITTPVNLEVSILDLEYCLRIVC